MTDDASPATYATVAGIVSRAAAAVVDLVVVLAILGGLYGVLALMVFSYSPTGYAAPSLGLVFSGLAAVLVSVVYLAACWTVSGRTAGCTLMGLMVVDRHGRKLKWHRSLVRSAFCVFFVVGLAWSAIDRRRRSVQDIALRTRVIYSR